MTVFNKKVKLLLIGIAICAVVLFFSVSAALAAQNVSVRGGVSVTYKYYPSSTLSKTVIVGSIPEDENTFNWRIPSQVETITFDYYNESKHGSLYEIGAVDNEGKGLDNGGISMYKNATGDDIYVLSKGEILAPTDCSELFTQFVYEDIIDTPRMYTLTELRSITFNNFNTENVTRMSGMFVGDDRGGMSNSNSLEALDLSSFNTPNLKYMSNMFEGCSSLTSLDVSNFNTSNVTDMQGMFEGCSSLKEIDLTSFNTSNVTTMAKMFSGCSSLISLDLTSFNTSNVTTMGYMFSGCTSLESVDISSFTSSSSGAYVEKMFYNCSNMHTLTMPKQVFKIDSIATIEYADDASYYDVEGTECSMFEGCVSLTSLDLTRLDTSDMQDMSRMFYGCNLKTLDLSSFDTVRVNSMGEMGLRHKTIVGDKWKFSRRVDVSRKLFSEYCIGPAGYTSERFYSYLVLNHEMLGINFRSDDGTVSQDGVFYSKYVDIDKSAFSTAIDTLFEPFASQGYTSLSLSFKEQCYDYHDIMDVIGTSETASVGSLPTGQIYGAANGGASIYVKNAENGHVTLEVVCCSLLRFPEDCSNFVSASAYKTKITALDFSKNIYSTNVKNMSYMFNGCSGLTNLDLSGLDTSNVTNMSYMFNGCSKLTSLDLYNFNTSNVTDMGYMFLNCYSLQTLDISSFNTSKVTTMSEMMNFCTDIEKVIVGEQWSTASLVGNNYLFHYGVPEGAAGTSKSGISYACIDYKSDDETVIQEGVFFPKYVNLNKQAFTNAIKTLIEQYSGYTYSIRFSEQVYSHNDVVSILDSHSHASVACLPTGQLYGAHNGGASMYAKSVGNNHVELEVISSAIIKLPEDCSNLISTTYRTRVTSVDFSNNIDTSLVKNMSGMFNTCTKLTSLNLSGFDTTNVTNMSNMFKHCTKLTNLDISNFKTSNVTSMQNMFYNCWGLTTLDITNFDTKNVTDMSYMFADCEMLTSLNLSSFNTRKVQNMEGLFYQCVNLEKIVVNEIIWSTDSLTNGADMFYKCLSLVGQNGTSFSSEHISSEYARVDGKDGKPGYFSVR